MTPTTPSTAPFDAQIEAAVKALIDKLEAIHADDRYKTVWTSYMLHGGNYTGPNYVDELAAAKAALLSAQSTPDVAKAVAFYEAGKKALETVDRMFSEPGKLNERTVAKMVRDTLAPKFEVGQKPIGNHRACTCGNSDAEIKTCDHENCPYKEKPTPLLPSSDEVQKLLERLDAFANTLGDEADDINTVILEVMRLQSENASLRVQGDAERCYMPEKLSDAEVEKIQEWLGWDTRKTVEFVYDNLRKALQEIDEDRTLTRPTTPSPDEAKGGE